MPSSFDAIPRGSNLLIDANIFIYALTAKSAQCKGLLERCSREEIYGISLFEVIHEATHQFMLGEAVSKGLTEVKKARKYLQEHPERVRLLTDYWASAKRILSLNVVFLPMEESILFQSQAERTKSGLLTNDSVIVGAMKEYGITLIATADKHFDSVTDISVFSPTDVLA